MRTRHQTTGFRPRLEVLEDRCVPSASTLDPSFNGTGFAITSLGSQTVNSLTALTVQPDGKIVAVGRSANNGVGSIAVVRYTANGVLDTTFNGTGERLISLGTNHEDGATSVTVENDGKILIGGSDLPPGGSQQFVVLRLNSDGTSDNTFDGNGALTLAPGTDARDLQIATETIGTNTDIVLAGDAQTINSTTNHQAVLMRLLPDGSPDTTFGTAGTVIKDTGGNQVVAGLEVFNDGTILIGSTSSSFNVPLQKFFVAQVFEKVNSDGSPETAFGNSGGISVQVNPTPATSGVPMDGMDVAPTGKIVTVGDDDAGNGVLAQFTSTGQLDTTFGLNGTVALMPTPFAIGDDQMDVKVDANGKILVIGLKSIPSPGFANFAVARYTTNGVLDTTFGTGGLATFNFASVDRVTAALDAHNRLLLGGETSETFAQFVVARIGDPLPPPPQVVNLVGTTNSDTLTVSATTATQIAVKLNGVTTTYSTLAGPIELSFDGLGGGDNVIVADNFNPTVSVLSPDTLNLDVAGKYHVNTVHTEHIWVYGKINDITYLYDSPGDDTFVSTGTYATMTGPGFTNIVVGQSAIYGVANSGGNDVVYLYDSGLSPGSNDHYYAGPTYAVYQFANNFVRGAYGFERSIGVSTNGNDSAVFTDSSSADTLYAYPTASYFQGGAMNMSAFNFKQVDAYSTSASDTAVLLDSPGNDSFFAQGTEAHMVGPGFFNLTHGFVKNLAFATQGGNDSALLEDSAGNAQFVGTDTYAHLASAGSFNQVQGFATVNAIALAHGDTAFLYDSPGNDALFGSGDRAALTMPGLTYNLFKFDVVVAMRSKGADTEHIDAINFIFSRLGGWVPV